MTTTIAVLLLALAIVMVVHGVRSYRAAATLSDFFLMDRRLRLGGLSSSLVMTNLSLGNFIFLCAIWGYYYGVSGTVWIVICIILLTVTFTFFAKHFKSYIEDKGNFGTVHEFLELRCRRSVDDPIARQVRILASVATIVCLLFALVLELYLASLLLQDFIGLNAGVGFVVLTAIVSLYTSFGGFRTVVFTDILQAVVMVLGMLAAVALLGLLPLPWKTYSSIYGPPSFVGVLTGTGWANALSISVIGFGWLLVTMDTWQRNAAARSIDTSVRGALIGGAAMIIAVVVWSFLGISVRTAVEPAASGQELASQLSGGLNPLRDLFLLAPGQADWQGVAFGLFGVALVMAGFSTADTFLVVSAHSGISDLLIGRTKGKTLKDLDEAQQRAFAVTGRAILGVMGFCVIAVGYSLGELGLLADPITLFFVAYSVQFSLLVPVVLAVRPRCNPFALRGALVSGLAASLFVGFGSALALQRGTPTLLSLPTADILALTPVVTVAVGTFSAVFIHALAKRTR